MAKKTRRKKEVKLTAEINSLRSMLHDANDGKIHGLDLLLFLYIASYAWGDGGVCKQTITVIAKDFKKSRVTIQRSLKSLRKNNYIQHIYRIRKHDETIVEVSDWDEVIRLKKKGNNVASAWFKIKKKGFKTFSI